MVRRVTFSSPEARFGSPEALARSLKTHPAVYPPSQDSFLLARTLYPQPPPSPAVGTPPRKALRILDLCCGSGICGFWAALHGAHVTALDLNPLAVSLSRRNARRLGLTEVVQVHRGDLFQALPPSTSAFDVILCNPPYLPRDERGRTGRTLPGEAAGTGKWQALALEGGSDGAAVVRRILARARHHLVMKDMGAEGPGTGRDGRATIKSHPAPVDPLTTPASDGRLHDPPSTSRGPLATPTPPNVNGGCLYLLVSTLTRLRAEDLTGWHPRTAAELKVGAFESLKVLELRP